jgi:2-keto-3-deoxy-6-phosphogluconate aldolase
MDVRHEIGRSRVVAVLRARDTRFFAPVSDALVSHGISVIEFTLTTPGALAALERYRSSGSEACLGVGTVLSASDGAATVSCGAEFLVTPVRIPGVVAAGAALGVPVIWGAMTSGRSGRHIAMEQRSPRSFRAARWAQTTPGSFAIPSPIFRSFLAEGFRWAR